MEKNDDNQHNEDYTDFFKASTEGDSVLRNNEVAARDDLDLKVGFKIRTEYGIATVTKIREDKIVEATAGIMTLYLQMEKLKLYLSPNDCGKILDYAMDFDKAHYTKKVNRTTLSTTRHLYRVKMQTDTGANCSVTSHKSILHQFKRIKSYSIGGVKAEDEAVKAIGTGYIKWTSRHNQVL